jgi:integrase
MSVRKVTTGWRVVVDVGKRPDGKRDQRTKTFRTKKEAEAWREEARSQVRTGTYVKEHQETFGQYAERWLLARRDVRASSVVAYRKNLKPFLAAVGHLPLQRVTTADLDAVVASLLALGGRDGRGASARTAGLYLDTVGAVFAAAAREGLVSRDPSRAVVRPRIVAKESPAYSASDLAAFVSFASTDRYGPLVRLLALGMRRGEVLGLTWGAVDLEGATLEVRQTRSFVGTVPKIGEPKTRASRRSLHLDAATLGTLRAHRQQQRREHLRLGVSFGPDTLLAMNAACEPIHPDTFAYTVRGLMRRAGLPVIPVHSLRHSSVSAMLGQGVPLHVVARWHGHSPAVMMRTYAHADTEALEAASAAAAGVLRGPVADVV